MRARWPEIGAAESGTIDIIGLIGSRGDQGTGSSLKSAREMRSDARVRPIRPDRLDRRRPRGGCRRPGTDRQDRAPGADPQDRGPRGTRHQGRDAAAPPDPRPGSGDRQRQADHPRRSDPLLQRDGCPAGCREQRRHVQDRHGKPGQPRAGQAVPPEAEGAHHLERRGGRRVRRRREEVQGKWRGLQRRPRLARDHRGQVPGGPEGYPPLEEIFRGRLDRREPQEIRGRQQGLLQRDPWSSAPATSS